MSSRTTRSHRILIYDDEPAVLRAIGIALESHGYAIIATRSGEQPVARAASEQPDVILIDLDLPGIDGRETIRRIRAETKVEALDLGADNYIEERVCTLSRGRAAARGRPDGRASARPRTEPRGARR